jgi:hypothetical protein
VKRYMPELMVHRNKPSGSFLAADATMIEHPEGGYVPAEVAERLLAELVTTLQWFSDFGSISDSPMAVEFSIDERIMAIEAALKFADGETPT